MRTLQAAVGVAFSLLSGMPAAVAQECVVDDCVVGGYWRICPPHPVDADLLALSQEDTGGDVLVDADTIDISDPERQILAGDVTLRDGERAIRAAQVIHNESTNTVLADNEVLYSDDAIQVSAQQVSADLERDQATIDDAEYLLINGRGRGEAAQIVQNPDGVSVLSDVTYTTCPAGQRSWHLSAREMALTHGEAVGEARGVTIRVKDVPVFYLPYVTFPLNDERKSGFLAPSIGYSSENGLDLEVPYYLNLRPDMDATIIPRVITKRGFGLGGQYRYLLERGGGQLDFDYLPNDDILDRDRGYGRFTHANRFNDNFAFNASLQHASDDQYFEDFGLSLYDTSRRLLPSNLALNGAGELWTFNTEVNYFQSIDPFLPPTQEPYNRLPRLTFTGELPTGGGFRAWLDSEYVTFERDVGVTGQRLDLFPKVSYTLRAAGGYVKALAGYRYTQYELDDVDVDPDRTLGIGSLEAGLFFDRDTQFAGANWLQTLEPRIHYLYVPFENQDDLPRFDTRELTFGIPTLYSLNRFVGGDRHGDANQVSVGITTRLLNRDTGRELLTATVGQIYYFEDRLVGLRPTDPVETDSTSPFIAELDYRPLDRWTTSLGLHWDFDREEAQYALARVQYLHDGRLANFSYRLREGSVEQVDASTIWPLNENWRLMARLNYSLRDDRVLEALAGVAYETCCWAVRLLGRNYVNSDFDTDRTSIFLEFVFRGLGSVGRDPGRLLERSVLGYNEYRRQYGW